MALAKRPSENLKNKRNINPSINRDTEVVAEDIKEIADIQEDHAIRIDELSRANEGSKFYGFKGTLALFEATFPNAEEDGFGVIDPANGNPQTIARVINGVWSEPGLVAPIQRFNSKVNFPDPGLEDVWYIAKDSKVASLYYDGGYKDFGKDGNNGLSAYQLAVAFGFEGTEADWLVSLQGKSAYQSALDNGFVGTEAEWITSIQGAAGKSAYQSAVDNGFVGTEAEWIASVQGVEGKSAYQLWLDEGNNGTLQDYLTSLEGQPGPQGKSNYQLWLDEGNVGTEQDYLNSQVGPPGPAGAVNSVSGTAVDNSDPANPIINLPAAGGSSNEQVGITPTGTINGTNKIFTLPSAYAAGKIKVYRNGIRQKLADDYTEVSTTSIEFVVAPLVDAEGPEKILIDYYLL
ncbi:hypothetical protein SAMN04487764_1502 [Gillisia sp. Hel1_33_143]|uniref:hypothetical protein n=1 Tax=Gillisia sp. Hel1_33_143 TaxID=1336796 RepID=UPI00087A47B7|nr:hypothetical protein [Gillisia sp. Hel1_33_143]SDS12049.1 hypothetical protein SAMN04487764_1502 [Gillisia sp. Hel1_33_143]